MACIASAPHGGGVGLRDWVCNAQVPADFPYTDLDAFIGELAVAHDCRGTGVGMLTAARVADASHVCDEGIEVWATVGVTLPTWAAAVEDDPDPVGWHAGTINVFARLAEPLSPAALVNAVMTVTEAKTQALIEAGIAGTGTASDAVCIACPAHGSGEEFGGPRSRLGGPLARAVHRAINAGLPSC
jgi:adenosylcobinamide amidohydrolase